MAGIKKKVDVVCYRPFKLGIANFSGSCNNITLDADSIKICLENKAMVSEVLKNGKRVPLDFGNYNKKNPMGYDIDGAFTDIMGPRTYTVNSINKKGNQIATIKMNDDQPPVIIQNGSTGIVRNLNEINTPAAPPPEKMMSYDEKSGAFSPIEYVSIIAFMPLFSALYFSTFMFIKFNFNGNF